MLFFKILIVGLLMFKLLLGKVYTGSDHNQHVGSDAKFQSKHVTSGAWGGGHGNMRIIGMSIFYFKILPPDGDTFHSEVQTKPTICQFMN